MRLARFVTNGQCTGQAMAEAAISINGRVYKLACSEDEMPRLHQLSQIVRAKLDGVVAEHGQVGDDRLLLLTALMIADDMLEAREKLKALEGAVGARGKPVIGDGSG